MKLRVPKKTLFRSSVAPPDLPIPQDAPPNFNWDTLCNQFMADWFNDPQRQIDDGRKQGVFHPSAGLHPNNGTLCHRNVVFDLLHAPRSRQNIPPRLGKVLSNGRDRHRGLQEMFSWMATARYAGIKLAHEEVSFADDLYCIEGSADQIIVFETGHRLMFDFKTISPKQKENLREIKPEHRLQLNTYLGMAFPAWGIRQAYCVYEDKASQQWTMPQQMFFQQYDAKLYRETQAFCQALLLLVSKKAMPAFEEKRCDRVFCSYTSVCDRDRANETKWDDYDQRPEETRQKHLRVLA